MEYKRLGRAGIRVSELSFGSWLTFDEDGGEEMARSCMHAAFDAGVNFFDNAEVYSKGLAEELMGKVLKDYRREDLVVSTKLFWGGDGPNDLGLSWKHLVEGTKASLKRMDLEYVDLLFCHRPDPDTPVEETVRAMDVIVRSGLAFYWGTSEWPATAIEEAHECAMKFNCIPPAMEQPQYNLFERERMEVEYAPLFEKYGMGTTIWSPLASGILTGKYQEGVPAGSRLDKVRWLRHHLNDDRIARVSRFLEIAKELDCTPAQLGIAWCLQNPNVSTVITGATQASQVQENLQAIKIKQRLTPDIMERLGDLAG